MEEITLLPIPCKDNNSTTDISLYLRRELLQINAEKNNKPHLRAGVSSLV
jgi:hypothetical protein